MEQKVDPYLRPLYDALHEMLGSEKVARLLERTSSRLRRWRTCAGARSTARSSSLDEAQNTTAEQMKMFLTHRFLAPPPSSPATSPRSTSSAVSSRGLKEAIEILRNVEGITFTPFLAQDVVRHTLVQKIVEAYALRDQADERPGTPEKAMKGIVKCAGRGRAPRPAAQGRDSTLGRVRHSGAAA